MTEEQVNQEEDKLIDSLNEEQMKAVANVATRSKRAGWWEGTVTTAVVLTGLMVAGVLIVKNK